MSDLTGLPAPKMQDMFQKVDVDDAVAESFPSGSKLICAWPHGASFWTRTARIDVELPTKEPHSYFLKVAMGPVGLGMLRGEYFGAKEMYRAIPEGIPRPVAWGTYRSDPETHFYLCDFVDMDEDLPDVHSFCSLLARLHRESRLFPDAPEGFGFVVDTYKGTIHQDTTWCKTWEESFTLHIKAFLEQEQAVHGPSQEFKELVPALIDKVIPRLLRPLQTKGRSIKPVLVHGDIWYGNIATNVGSGEALMFDPSVFWAHNEYDLHFMNVPRCRLGRHWMREYHKHFPISAPEDDYDDRNTLYAILGELVGSTLYPDTANFRKLAVGKIQSLVDKFPKGYEDQ